MDSTNFQHHDQQQHHHHHHQQQLQDHFGVGCSPLNIPPSPYAVSNNVSLHWNTNSTSAILPTSTATSSNTFSNKPYENDFLSSATPNSPIPKIEDGDMLSSFPSFSSLLQNPTSSATALDNMNPWSFNGLLSSASAGVPYSSRGLLQQFPLEPNNWNGSSSNNNNNHHHHGFSGTSFLNQLGLVSSPNNSTASTVSSSSPRLGLNLQAMDFLGNNASFSSQSRPMSYDVVGEEVISPAGKVMSNKNSSLMSGSLTGTKRAAGSSSSSDHQSKASTSNSHASTKKSPLKVSCPPFKVRKEKLGERIAALHQLVSPFGKTDTASVLTEAIGYIQFLQDQIHTLCMPHPKPSRSKSSRPFQAGLGISEDDGKEEERVELGRRGLCLVPFSWTSYITPNQMDGSNHHPPYF